MFGSAHGHIHLSTRRRTVDRTGPAVRVGVVTGHHALRVVRAADPVAVDAAVPLPGCPPAMTTVVVSTGACGWAHRDHGGHEYVNHPVFQSLAGCRGRMALMSTTLQGPHQDGKRDRQRHNDTRPSVRGVGEVSGPSAERTPYRHSVAHSVRVRAFQPTGHRRTPAHTVSHDNRQAPRPGAETRFAAPPTHPSPRPTVWPNRRSPGTAAQQPKLGFTAPQAGHRHVEGAGHIG